MSATYDIIHLADNEWGNEVMGRIADDWFADNPDCRFVEVHEHAGWWICYQRREGQPAMTVSSASVPRYVADFSGKCVRRIRTTVIHVETIEQFEAALEAATHEARA